MEQEKQRRKILRNAHPALHRDTRGKEKKKKKKKNVSSYHHYERKGKGTISSISRISPPGPKEKGEEIGP